MPDSIGLYVGNPVTQMGYPIGEVTRVTPSAQDVRVDFVIDNGRKFPTDVKAVIRSTSILADRSLELVGNYTMGPRLDVNNCIPLQNSSTPKSLSEIIGSATRFVNSINPGSSTNIRDVVNGLDEATRNTGQSVRQLLNNSARVLDAPQQPIGDIASITTNLAQLTSTFVDMRDVLKETMVAAQDTTADLAVGMAGAADFIRPVGDLVLATSDIERNLGEDIQKFIDAVSVFIRKASQHAPWLTTLLNPVPWWIDTLTNHVNNRQFNVRIRPPLYRVRTPDGLLQCGIMNASVAGSCADIAGSPYAVDIDLLKYVLTKANQ